MKLYGSDTPSPQHKSPPVIAGPGTRINWLPIDLPEGVRLGFVDGAAGDYLDARNIEEDYWPFLGLADWVAKERIVIPYFDLKGDVIYLAAHSYVGDTPKYMYPKGPKPLYVPPIPFYITPIKNRAVIVEGQFDAIMVAQVGYRAIAIGGCHLAAHVEQDLLDECEGRDVTVCLDGDALAQASKLVMRLLELGVYAKIAILRPGEDPASVGVERLKELIG